LYCRPKEVQQRKYWKIILSWSPRISKPISCALNAANPQPNDRGGLEAFIGTASALSRRAEQCDFVTFGDDELG